MTKKGYPLTPGGRDRVEIEWSGLFHNTEVRFDGRVLGTIPIQRDFEDGRSFEPAEGLELSVQLISDDEESPEVLVLMNGNPLPGSTDKLRDRWTARMWVAAIATFVAGGLSVVGALFVGGSEGLYVAVAGLVLAGLGGLFVWRKSRLILGVVVGLYAADTVFAAIALMPALRIRPPKVFTFNRRTTVIPGKIPWIPFYMLLLRASLIVAMAQGFGPVKNLRLYGRDFEGPPDPPIAKPAKRLPPRAPPK